MPQQSVFEQDVCRSGRTEHEEHVADGTFEDPWATNSITLSDCTNTVRAGDGFYIGGSAGTIPAEDMPNYNPCGEGDWENYEAEVGEGSILAALKKAHGFDTEWFTNPCGEQKISSQMCTLPGPEVDEDVVEKDDTDLRVSTLAQHLDTLRYLCHLIGPSPRDVYLATIRLMRARLRKADRYVKGCLEDAEAALQELPSNLSRAEEYEQAREVCFPAREGIGKYLNLQKEIIDDEITYNLLKKEMELLGAEFPLNVDDHKEDLSGENHMRTWRDWHDAPKPA